MLEGSSAAAAAAAAAASPPTAAAAAAAGSERSLSTGGTPSAPAWQVGALEASCGWLMEELRKSARAGCRWRRQADTAG